MAQFGAVNANFTPALAQDNWCFDAGAAAGGMAKVKMFSWGGSSLVSTGYRTAWKRPSTNGTGAFTALATQATNPLAVQVTRVGTFATAPVLAAEPSGLYEQSWNSLGGGGVIVLPIGGEWFVVFSATAGHQQIACRNYAGVEANLTSYGLQVEE